MRLTGPVLRFLVIFIPLYGILIAPWPGWNAWYGKAFQDVFGAIVSTEGADRAIRLGAAPSGGPLDTEIDLKGTSSARMQGRVESRKLFLDSRSVGWIPTALLFSLVAATPIVLKRRIWAACLGMPLVHAFILFTLELYIWEESLTNARASDTFPQRALVWVANGLVETFVVQLGSSFFVPVAIWIIVTFEREDFEAALGRWHRRVR